MRLVEPKHAGGVTEENAGSDAILRILKGTYMGENQNKAVTREVKRVDGVMSFMATGANWHAQRRVALTWVSAQLWRLYIKW
jgi:hypothetical protein